MVAVDGERQPFIGRIGDITLLRQFDPATAPNLSFTTVHSVILNGTLLAPADTYWNTLLRAVISEAKKTLSTNEVKQLVICNSVLGKKDDDGYSYLPDAGISVQAADANKAWKATYLIARAIKASIEIEFGWRHNSKAALPGQAGKFVLDWSDQR